MNYLSHFSYVRSAVALTLSVYFAFLGLSPLFGLHSHETENRSVFHAHGGVLDIFTNRSHAHPHGFELVHDMAHESPAGDTHASESSLSDFPQPFGPSEMPSSNVLESSDFVLFKRLSSNHGNFAHVLPFGTSFYPSAVNISSSWRAADIVFDFGKRIRCFSSPRSPPHFS